MTRVLFVCLGNICRSPTAHGVFEQKIQSQGLDKRIEVDSAGTASWHQGNLPDTRSMRAAKGRGYSLEHLRARQVTEADFDHFDYILAMDANNLADLKALRPTHFTGHLGLFLDFGHANEKEVPDPYHGGEAGFQHVLDLVEDACDGLIHHIINQK